MNTILLLMAIVCQQPVDKDMFEMFPSTAPVIEKVAPTEPPKPKMYTLKDKYGTTWQNSNKQYLIEDVEKINSTPDLESVAIPMPKVKAKPKKFCRAEDRFGRLWQADSPEELKRSLDRANSVNDWPAQRYNVQPQQQMTYSPQTSFYRGGGMSVCLPGASA
jgi:hypothetical protein